MRSFALVVLMLFATPALAAPACSYVSSDGRSLVFSEDGVEPDVVYKHVDGSTEICDWRRTDEGTGQRIWCDGFRDFMERTSDGLMWLGEHWTRRCPPGA